MSQVRKLIVKPASTVSVDRLATVPPVPADAHPICFNPSMVSVDTFSQAQNRKYSMEIWSVIKRVLRTVPNFPLATTATAEEKKAHGLVKKLMKQKAMYGLRILMVADSEVGTPDLTTGFTLWFSLAKSQQVDEDGMLTHILGSPCRRAGQWYGRDVPNLPYLDVTNVFWDQYVRFGKCARGDLGFREANHDWNDVTRTSKRCRCCGMWSYRRQQRTTVKSIYRDSAVRKQERTITQMPVWEHQMSRLYRNPYLRLIPDA